MRDELYLIVIFIKKISVLLWQILKDVTVRYKILTGHKVHYVPGWDCHGTPIEQKALTELSADQNELSPMEIRKIGINASMKCCIPQHVTVTYLGIVCVRI